MDNRWLKEYERLRTNPYSSIKGQLSSRFQLDGLSWAEIREIPIEGLWEGATFGTCFEALRKTWYAYKRNKKDGLPAPDLALRIMKLQKALGLPMGQFGELEWYGEDWVNEELNSQLQKEELSGWEEEEDDDPW
jgi:hypothetical protein